MPKSRDNLREIVRLAQIAAWIEAEGTITLYKNDILSRDGVTKLFPRLSGAVSMVNTDKGIVQMVAHFMGAKTVEMRPKSSPKSNKPIFVARKNGRVNVELLEKLMPYLLVKRRQAEIILEFYKGFMSFTGKAGGKASDTVGKVHVPKSERDRRWKLYMEMRGLNSYKRAKKPTLPATTERVGISQ